MFSSKGNNIPGVCNGENVVSGLKMFTGERVMILFNNHDCTARSMSQRSD